MKMPKNIKKSAVILVLVFVLSFLLVHIVQAVTGDPGSDADPVVTQSYVDQATKWVVVDVNTGKQLVAGGSSEIILRQGQATAVGSSAGGLSDVTAGADILTGKNIPPNHLLIVPRDDGRGLKATNNVKILIKGSYAIK